MSDRRETAHRMYTYLTGSKFFPDNLRAAWDDAKSRMRQMTKKDLEDIDNLTFGEYCLVTGCEMKMEEI